jgi:hypothetical protein
MHIVAVSASRVSAAMAMLGMWLGQSTAARAERRLAITLVGECPTRGAVIAAIEGTLPDVEVITDASEPTLRVLVSDDGTSYRIEIAGMMRTFVDAAANCEERARKTAVMAVLALEPSASDAQAPPRSAAAIERARHAPPGDIILQIEAGSVVDSAPRSDGSLISAGVDLRFAIGGRNGGLVVGGTVVAPIELEVTGGRASVRRVPLDLALRSQLGGDEVAVVFELGPRFTIQHSEGVNVMRGAQAVRLEVGARLAARLETWPLWGNHGTYIAVQGEYVPFPSRFMLLGVGEVGQMPSLWLGVSLGLALRRY